MAFLSRRIQESPDSATVRIADRASELRRAGAPVLDFSAGRAAEHTPQYICDAASQAMERNATHQTPARGEPDYLTACARKLVRENGIEYDASREIIATMGCKQGLLLTLMSCLNPGDEVIVEDPGFVSYAPTIRYCGGVPVPVSLTETNRFRWTEEALEAAVTERTRAILFCSPHNPTGTVHDRIDLERIARLAIKHDLLVIADETYERLTWGNHRHCCISSLPRMRERTVSLMGVTKSFSMGGWRVGFAAAPPHLIDAMVRVQAHLMTCVGSISQAGATRALGEPAPDAVLGLWSEWEKRCRTVTDALRGMQGFRCHMQEGGFYAWIDITATSCDDVALANYLIEERHLALVPGSAFGPHGRGFLRMTCVKSPADLKEGLERLAVPLPSPREPVQVPPLTTNHK